MNKNKWIEKTAKIIVDEGYISEYQDNNCKIHDIEQNKGGLNLLDDLTIYLKDSYQIDIFNFSNEIQGDGWSTILIDRDQYDYKKATFEVQKQYDIIRNSMKQFNQLYPTVPIV